MGGHEARTYWEDVGLALLISAIVLAPFAWLLEMQISYSMLKWACEHDRRGVILLMPVGSLGLVGIAGAMAWSCWARLRGQATDDGGRKEDRSYFLALAGLAMSALFALLILSAIAPRILLSPCE
jgi:hypothetical protein